MMGKINSKIAFIQKRCKNYSNISAEGLMYGIANIMAMRPEFLAVLLKQDDYEDREMFAIERRKASVIIRKAKLNLDLIKNGSSLVLPFFKGSEDSPFYRGITKLEEPVYFHTIVSYVIELFGMFGMDKEPVDWRKLGGLALAIVGIAVFQWE